MSGALQQTSPLAINQPMTVGAPGLLPTNTNLLQPVSGYFRLFDALWLLMLSQASTTGSPAVLASPQQETQILQNQIGELRQQIDALNARLTQSGID